MCQAQCSTTFKLIALSERTHRYNRLSSEASTMAHERLNDMSPSGDLFCRHHPQHACSIHACIHVPSRHFVVQYAWYLCPMNDCKIDAFLTAPCLLATLAAALGR